MHVQNINWIVGKWGGASSRQRSIFDSSPLWHWRHVEGYPAENEHFTGVLRVFLTIIQCPSCNKCWCLSNRWLAIAWSRMWWKTSDIEITIGVWAHLRLRNDQSQSPPTDSERYQMEVIDWFYLMLRLYFFPFTFART